MTHLLLAWELGGGLGHLTTMRTLGEVFAARGAHCEFAVRDLDGAGQILDPASIIVHQAPLSYRSPAPERQSGYASLLRQSGWSDASALASRLVAWQTLIERSRCTLLLADHAPTAVLAARLAGLPVAICGAGFAVPPRQQPFPAFNPATTDTLLVEEAAVLEVANRALDRLGGPPLPQLQSLFDTVVTTGLLTYPELDPYAPRPAAARYLGSPKMSRGQAVEWGALRQPRVLVYLRPFAGLDALLQALSLLPVQALVRVDGLPAAALAAHLRPGLVITDRPVDLEQAVARCDLCINHGQDGTTSEMLLAGKPGLLLPGNRGQQLVAEAAARLGAAQVMATAVACSVEDYRRAIQQLLDEPAFARQAQAFASRYADDDRERKLADWCAECLRHAADGRMDGCDPAGSHPSRTPGETIA